MYDASKVKPAGIGIAVYVKSTWSRRTNSSLLALYR
jgi:hypothetical protein